MKGEISTEHTGWCGTCQQWLQLPERKRSDMAKQLKRRGWSYNRKLGWRCAECTKKNVQEPVEDLPW